MYTLHGFTETLWKYLQWLLYNVHFLKHLSFNIILCLTFSCRTSTVLTFFPFTCTKFSTAANNICNALDMFRKFICNFHYIIGFTTIIIITTTYFVSRDRTYCWSYNRQRHWNSDFPRIFYIRQCLQPKPRHDKCKFHNFGSGFAHKVKLLTRFLQIVSSFAGHRAFPPWLCARMDQSIQWRDVCCPMIYSHRG